MLDREENPRYGLDLESWIAEALIDTLIPCTYLPELDSMGLAWEDEEAVSHFVDLVEGTNCQIALNVMPLHLSPEAFGRKSVSIYAKGVENLFYWDSAGPRGRANFGTAWNTLRRLGHGEEVEQWRQLGEPNLASASIPLHRVGDFDLTYPTCG